MNKNELHTKLVAPLKARRKFFGISQAEMSKKLGHKSSAFISLIENGERNLNVCDYVLWREALGMSLDFLHDPEVVSDDWKNEEDPFERVKRYNNAINGNE